MNLALARGFFRVLEVLPLVLIIERAGRLYETSIMMAAAPEMVDDAVRGETCRRLPEKPEPPMAEDRDVADRRRFA